MQPELIIFDCDGVLVDSEALVIDIEAQMLTAAGFPMTPDEVAETCIGLSYGSMMAMLEERFGQPVPDTLSEAIQAQALAQFPGRLQPVAGIADVLGRLDLPRCVASSSNLDRIELCLGITGLRQEFVEGSIFSAQMVERGKPAPDLFLHAAASMGVAASRCVVVEDSPAGVAAGVAAGMPVIGFLAGGHVRPSLGPRLTQAGASTLARTGDELAPLLGALPFL